MNSVRSPSVSEGYRELKGEELSCLNCGKTVNRKRAALRLGAGGTPAFQLFTIHHHMTDRIEVFKQMLESDPGNTMVMFGLANEYQKAGMNAEAIEALEKYLELADDEGAAWGMLARAYESAGDSVKAKAAYEKGIEAALAHGHPSMAEDFRFALDNDY